MGIREGMDTGATEVNSTSVYVCDPHVWQYASALLPCILGSHVRNASSKAQWLVDWSFHFAGVIA